MDAVTMQEASRPSAEVVPIPVDPAARLRAALRMLTTKLSEQGDVMADWRESADALALATSDLAASLRSCQQNLDRLGINVNAARAAARELEATADRLLETSAQA